MHFTDADLNALLTVTGEPVVIQLAGITVKTIQAKFRKDFVSVSLYEMNSGILTPAMTCKTSDLDGITTAHSFLIRGTEYKFDGKPEEQPSGLTLVHLGIKK